jgi:hypothetical protein
VIWDGVVNFPGADSLTPQAFLLVHVAYAALARLGPILVSHCRCVASGVPTGRLSVCSLRGWVLIAQVEHHGLLTILTGNVIGLGARQRAADSLQEEWKLLVEALAAVVPNLDAAGAGAALELAGRGLDRGVAPERSVNSGLRRDGEVSIGRFLLEGYGDLGHMLLPAPRALFTARLQRDGVERCRLCCRRRWRWRLLFGSELAEAAQLALHQRELGAQVLNLVAQIGPSKRRLCRRSGGFATFDRLRPTMKAAIGRDRASKTENHAARHQPSSA